MTHRMHTTAVYSIGSNYMSTAIKQPGSVILLICIYIDVIHWLQFFFLILKANCIDCFEKEVCVYV